MDYRTGQVLAYGGSASYNARATKKFQPQFDVLSDGWRQPGSSIKPINYAIGIEDGTMTAATLFMDVTTNFGGNFVPTQADKARARPGPPARGPPVLAEHPGDQGGPDQRPRSTSTSGSKDFGVHYVPGSAAGHVDGHRHARGPPDRHDRRLRRDRERRRADAADDDPQGRGLERRPRLARARREAGQAEDRSSAPRPPTS